MDARQLDLLIILTAHLVSENKFQRELTVFTRRDSDSKLFHDVSTFLQTTELQLEPQLEEKAKEFSVHGNNIAFFKQNNPGGSRKQVQPWLDEYLAANY